jgi:hypothetical protein
MVQLLITIPPIIAGPGVAVDPDYRVEICLHRCRLSNCQRLLSTATNRQFCDETHRTEHWNRVRRDRKEAVN